VDPLPLLHQQREMLSYLGMNQPLRKPEFSHTDGRRRVNENLQLSSPRMRRYNPFRPKKLRKYQDNDETHRTSISGVSIPRCNMDLKPRVKGNGSLTSFLDLKFPGFEGTKSPLTEYKALKEKVYPSHNNHLGNHHNHLSFHARHHAIHGGGVRHRVRWDAR